MGDATAPTPHGAGPLAPRPASMPTGGAFAVSEVVPIIIEAHAEAERLRVDWSRLRDAADRAKAEAKRTRATLMVRLRVFGNDATAGVPMRTHVERNEWADADEDVLAAELAADLAQSAAMTGREAYNLARSRFDMLRTALGMERDAFGAERGGR